MYESCCNVCKQDASNVCNDTQLLSTWLPLTLPVRLSDAQAQGQPLDKSQLAYTFDMHCLKPGIHTRQSCPSHNPDFPALKHRSPSSLCCLSTDRHCLKLHSVISKPSPNHAPTAPHSKLDTHVPCPHASTNATHPIIIQPPQHRQALPELRLVVHLQRNAAVRLIHIHCQRPCHALDGQVLANGLELLPCVLVVGLLCPARLDQGQCLAQDLWSTSSTNVNHLQFMRPGTTMAATSSMLAHKQLVQKRSEWQHKHRPLHAWRTRAGQAGKCMARAVVHDVQMLHTHLRRAHICCQWQGREAQVLCGPQAGHGPV